MVLAGERICGDGVQRVSKGGAEHKIERVMLIVVEEDGEYFCKCYGEYYCSNSWENSAEKKEMGYDGVLCQKE